MSYNNKVYDTFLKVGHYEGLSYLVLLGIAMPLKYLAGWPLAVKIMGSIHGALFVAFLYYLVQLKAELDFPIKSLIKGFVLSLVPFGTFVLKRYVVKETC
jgi:integral membrane protein